ncbi:hypothetical protein LSTR_LSTR008218 [Laodelphax striatellus]|uniref:Uncharacterized protein n=1 Tax=Laodelphax striatellus TaxID=195883 RepID=A0A482WJZ4_LAOST|nr:hypothetical protein LSTR_LSTR008218 [Laodelphax striatellus]
MASCFDFESFMELNALEEEGRKEILSFFEDLELGEDIPQYSHAALEKEDIPQSTHAAFEKEDIPQSSDATVEEVKSDENQIHSSYINFLRELLDFGTSSNEAETSREIWSRCVKEPNPCQTCMAEGKHFKKEFRFINLKEAFYKCENVECKDFQVDIGPIRVNRWDEPITEKEIEEYNIPGEIVEHIPVVTKRDLIRIVSIARYRDALELFEWGKREAEKIYDTEVNVARNEDAIPIDIEPPSKAEFLIDNVSDDEVEKIIGILNTLEKARKRKKKFEVKMKPKKEMIVESEPKVSHHSVESSLTAEVRAETPKISGSQKKKGKNNRERKPVLYDPATGNAVREIKPINAKTIMCNLNKSYNELFKKSV